MWGDPDLDAVRQGHRVHNRPLMRRAVHVARAGLALAAVSCAGTSTTTDPSDSPTGPGQLTFVAVAAGDDHSCGITADGTVYCWGGNEVGQLGRGFQSRLSEVPEPVSGDHTFVSITSGAFHACGVNAAGATYCWGFNVTGQIGDGTKTHRFSPVPIVGELEFDMVDAGSGHTCGVTKDGTAYCWGDLGEGRADNDPTTAVTVPVAVKEVTFQSIGSGGDHRCGVAPGGKGYCWGAGIKGRLGDGLLADSDVPVEIAGGHTFEFIDAGGSHTCGIERGGAAYCWGLNTWGQVGDGTRDDRAVPVAVTGGITFASVSAGDNHACGLDVGGAGDRWGLTVFGQPCGRPKSART